MLGDFDRLLYNKCMNTKQRKISALTVGLLSAVVVLIIGLVLALTIKPNQPTAAPVVETNASLPTPEITDGVRGEQFGVDKNINEETIDQYLGRDDAVYRDMRMLIDPGNYAAIGGDSYLSGYVDGFEIVPFPYIVNVSGLPEEVGSTYTGKTLFTQNDKGEVKANYAESMQILEDLFPKDKYIFLMCGGAGYAGMTKNLLIKLGWDADKIYNVGGYWFYEGDNNVAVKSTTDDGKATYAFWKVPYHEIDFNRLTAK